MILAWLNSNDGLHTYGINYYGKTLNNPSIKDKIKQFTIQVCKTFNCKYFIQGDSDNWLFIEFLGAR